MDESPLARGLFEFGVSLLEAETKERLNRIRDEPLGHLIDEAVQEHKRIQAEGRDVTASDVRKFTARIPAIVREAKRRKGDDQ